MRRSCKLVDSKRIGERHIRRNDEHHMLIVDSNLVHLTQTEYRLLLPLLSGGPMPFDSLAQSAFQCDIDGNLRRLLDKHMNHIRNKLRPAGLNVHCITRYGYIILSREREEVQELQVAQ